jgi:hypothetical protein
VLRQGLRDHTEAKYNPENSDPPAS